MVVLVMLADSSRYGGSGRDVGSGSVGTVHVFALVIHVEGGRGTDSGGDTRT